jgi:hypothetical protein
VPQREAGWGIEAIVEAPHLPASLAVINLIGLGSEQP